MEQGIRKLHKGEANMCKTFTIITGDKAKEAKETKLEKIYMKAFKREMGTISACGNWNQCKENVKRAVFYAVKYCKLEQIDRQHCEPRTLEQIQSDFEFLECVKMLMGKLTPREFMSMFPIGKEYDGARFECKDYFYTIEKLKEIDLDAPIGIEGLEDFLWIYWNDDLFAFNSVSFSIISNKYKAQTGKGVLEKWLEKQSISSYTMNQDMGIIKDNQTGEICKMSKKSSHLQIIK